MLEPSATVAAIEINICRLDAASSLTLLVVEGMNKKGHFEEFVKPEKRSGEEAGPMLAQVASSTPYA